MNVAFSKPRSALLPSPREHNTHSVNDCGFPGVVLPDQDGCLAKIDDAGQVSSYVSAVRNEGVIQDVLPFSLTLEDLMRIIGWDTPPAHARRV